MLNKYKNQTSYQFKKNKIFILCLMLLSIVLGYLNPLIYSIFTLLVILIFIWSDEKKSFKTLLSKSSTFSSIIISSILGSWIFLLDLFVKVISESVYINHLSEDFIIHCDNVFFGNNNIIALFLTPIILAFFYFGYFFERLTMFFPNWNKLTHILLLSLAISALALPSGFCFTMTVFTLSIVSGLIYVASSHNLKILFFSLVFYNLYYFIVYYFNLQRFLYYWLHNG